MSTAKIVGCLLLAVAVAFAGGAAERFVGSPRGVLPGATMLAVLLLSYPTVKWWYGGRRSLSFRRWALGAVVASAAATAVYLAVAARWTI